MNNIFPFFQDILLRFSTRDISKSLDVNENTVKRWIEKKEVPSQYYFDLCRMDNQQIDYSNFSSKDKDQFFTSKKTALYCWNKSLEILKNYDVDIEKYTFIEPSAGEGSFFNLFPEDKRIGIDIEPKTSNILKKDFLLWQPETKDNICVGNPPFGLRGHLALKFINHAAEFSDFVFFIVPQLFDSNGKGSCKSRVKRLNLIHSEPINPEFYYPDGKPVNVNVIFQAWSKHHKTIETKVNLNHLINLYSLSDGGTPSTTRNKKRLYSCDYYLSSTCFGKDNMRLYFNFEDLPQRKGYGIEVLRHKEEFNKIIKSINWSEVAFTSTNGALNLRFDIIEKEIHKLIQGTPLELSTNLTNLFALC